MGISMKIIATFGLASVFCASHCYATSPPIVQSVTPNPVQVVFGPVVTEGEPFEAIIRVLFTDANVNITLTPHQVVGVSGLSVTGGGPSPAIFTLRGRVDYSLNMQTVYMPLTVSALGRDGPSGFPIVVTPEPASLAFLGTTLLFRRRREVR